MASNPLLSQRAFGLVFGAAAIVARRPALAPLSRLLMSGLADLDFALRRGRPQRDLPAVAREWQRMFPDPATMPLVEQGERRVVAEVRVPCPVAGSGDPAACHRLMGYDRRLLERIGGRFEVLESRASEGVEVCRVALWIDREGG